MQGYRGIYSQGDTPLVVAVQLGDEQDCLPIVRVLLDHGADPNQHPDDCESSLFAFGCYPLKHWCAQSPALLCAA